MKVMTDNFVIQGDDQRVIAFSSQRIPFDSKKDWRADFKQALRAAIAPLKAREGEEIAAVYGSALPCDPVDTENALFYNLGQSPFRGCANHALSFATLDAEKTRILLDQQGVSGFRHYYEYRIIPFREGNSNAVASWSSLPLFPLRGEHSAFDYWQVIRRHLATIKCHQAADIAGDFGLDIHLESPETAVINLATVIKSLLDGVICAFHRMPEGTDSGRLRLAAERLGCPADMLLDRACTPLGQREYVRPKQNHVLWDPKDMSCKSARLSIRYGRLDWRFSGTLYAL